jgi:hypothetical protein
VAQSKNKENTDDSEPDSIWSTFSSETPAEHWRQVVNAPFPNSNPPMCQQCRDSCDRSSSRWKDVFGPTHSSHQEARISAVPPRPTQPTEQDFRRLWVRPCPWP